MVEILLVNINLYLAKFIWKTLLIHHHCLNFMFYQYLPNQFRLMKIMRCVYLNPAALHPPRDIPPPSAVPATL